MSLDERKTNSQIMQPSSLYRSLRYSIQDNYLILLIVLLGLILRIYDLGGESLWYDEVYSIEISRSDFTGIIKEILYQSDNNPPLYYFILHIWMALFGDSEEAVRLLSALIGSVSIFIIFALGRLLYNKHTGLIAALILAISVYQIQYSQEARAYALMSCLSLLSVYFFVKLSYKADFKNSVGYVLSSFLLIYTHYFGALIIIAQNIYFFSIFLIDRDKSPRCDLKRWIALQAILALLSMPEIIFLKETYALNEGFWIEQPNLMGLIGIFIQYSGTFSLFVIFSLLCLYVCVNRALSLRKNYFGGNESTSVGFRSSYISGVYLLIVLIILPVIIPFIYSQIKTPIFISRYMIGASVIFYLLVAKGIDDIVSKRIKLCVIALISLLSIVGIHRYYDNVDKEQWREAVEYIESNAFAGESIVVSPDYVLDAAHYYLKRSDLVLVPLTEQSDIMSYANDDSYWVILSQHSNLYHKGRDVLSLEEKIISDKKFKRLKLYHVSTSKE